MCAFANKLFFIFIFCIHVVSCELWAALFLNVSEWEKTSFHFNSKKWLKLKIPETIATLKKIDYNVEPFELWHFYGAFAAPITDTYLFICSGDVSMSLSFSFGDISVPCEKEQMDDGGWSHDCILHKKLEKGYSYTLDMVVSIENERGRYMFGWKHAGMKEELIFHVGNSFYKHRS